MANSSFSFFRAWRSISVCVIFRWISSISAGEANVRKRGGLKGLQVGEAVVSEKHANFIIAQKGCTYRDIIGLIDTLKRKVKEEFDVDLELELEIWE